MRPPIRRIVRRVSLKPTRAAAEIDPPSFAPNPGHKEKILPGSTLPRCWHFLLETLFWLMFACSIYSLDSDTWRQDCNPSKFPVSRFSYGSHCGDKGKSKPGFVPTRLGSPPSRRHYLAAQHFLNFLPLPQGQRSLRPAFAVAGRNLGAGSFCLDINFESGSRLCRKKRFNPAQR